MQINTDLKQRVVVHASQLPWQASPIVGVDRRMLYRDGDEIARATSIVRYAPGSQFSAHTHTGGEEFVVLEGVFSDEHGDYPAGSYLRNPPTSKHTPGSEPGTTIFVKLWQFDMDDRTYIKTHMDKVARIDDAHRPGVRVSPLYRDDHEDVRVEDWAGSSRIELDLPNGGELLVLSGGFREQDDDCAPHTWIRFPVGSRLQAETGEQGAKVWMKLGHLPFLEAMPPIATVVNSLQH